MSLRICIRRAVGTLAGGPNSLKDGRSESHRTGKVAYSGLAATMLLWFPTSSTNQNWKIATFYLTYPLALVKLRTDIICAFSAPSSAH
jgi:hypothetical protein